MTSPGFYSGYSFSSPELFSSASGSIFPQKSDFSQQAEQLPRPLLCFSGNPVSFTPFGQLPPVPDSEFYVNEQGLSSPRFIRMALNSIPVSASLLNSSGLPFAGIFQPFCELSRLDSEVPSIQYELFRCVDCFGYINPFFTMLENSKKIHCNLCGKIQLRPEQYNGPKDEFFELNRGTYEFKASKELSSKPSSKPIFFFCLETSEESLQMGIFHQVLTSLISIIDYVKPEYFFGVLTFDSEICVYRLGKQGIIQIAVGDDEGPNLTEYWESCVVCMENGRDEFKELLSSLLEIKFLGSKNCFSIGHVVNNVRGLFKDIGARVIIFGSLFGNLGQFKLDNLKVSPVHEVVDSIYQPNEAYSKLSSLCSESDIAIDLFVCTNHIVNIPSLSALSSNTGGDLYYFPGYNNEKDGERLHYYLHRILTRPQVSQLAIRVRCSTGISVSHYIGKIQTKGRQEVKVPVIDSDKSICLVFQHDSNLQEEKDYFIQVAVLYTNLCGERIIRIFNTKVYSTENFLNIFQNADCDALVNFYVRAAARQISEKSLHDIRENIQKSLIGLLVRTRKANSDMNYTRVLVPDSLKYVMLYLNSACKLPALTIGNVHLESRAFSLQALLSMPVLQLKLLLYPKIYEVDIGEHCIKHKNKLIPCSLKSLNDDSVYFVNNGDLVLCFIGEKVRDEWFFVVWGMNREEVLANEVRFEMDSGVCEKYRTMLEGICENNPAWHYSVYFHFQGVTSDYMLKRLMVEDALLPEVGYCESVTRLQKSLINIMSNQ